MTTEVKKTKKVSKTAPQKESNNIKVQLVKSSGGRSKKQIATLKGLGLTRMQKVSELQSSPSVLGMIKKVSHLVKVLGN